MALLELVRPEPDWIGALHEALLLPPGQAERRQGQDPWRPPAQLDRPRRISDDLAWFRDALDDPDDHGLRSLSETAAVGAWRPVEDVEERLRRLEDRGVLEAAGFLLHEEDAAPVA